MKYKIKKLTDKIFLVLCPDHYDLCMLFLRYQEFYESPNPKFRGKPFAILDYMEWYSKNRKGNVFFSYPYDWGGFNIPTHFILELMVGVKDWNKYDQEMEKILDKVGHDSYLIGLSELKTSAIQHEIAHGMYSTVPEYKKEVSKLVESLSPKIKKVLYKELARLGYAKSVWGDEIQAYMSTKCDGMDLKRVSAEMKEEMKKFRKVFLRHKRGLGL